jgi:hypothetical protein
MGRSVIVAKMGQSKLAARLQTFEQWLTANAARIPIG